MVWRWRALYTSPHLKVYFLLHLVGCAEAPVSVPKAKKKGKQQQSIQDPKGKGKAKLGSDGAKLTKRKKVSA